MKDNFLKLRVSDEIKELIRIAAIKENRTMSNWVESLIIKELNTTKKINC